MTLTGISSPRRPVPLQRRHATPAAPYMAHFAGGFASSRDEFPSLAEDAASWSQPKPFQSSSVLDDLLDTTTKFKRMPTRANSNLEMRPGAVPVADLRLGPRYATLLEPDGSEFDIRETTWRDAVNNEVAALIGTDHFCSTNLSLPLWQMAGKR